VLSQAFPKEELEQHLAGSLKFHAEHREALRTALKTYLNHGQPVPDDGSGAAADIWNDALDESGATWFVILSSDMPRNACNGM
jgi:hypothetical protein